MAEHLEVIIDTDILIKAYRGDSINIANLKLLKGSYCISVMSAVELIAGSKNIKQFTSLNKVLRVYPIIHFDESISKMAFKVYKDYILSHSPKLFDCLIAATALNKKFLIYTDNKKDFNFIEGIKFYKEK
ncbi:MAG: PIN domain-containing protein [Ginsengibacter sp.]